MSKKTVVGLIPLDYVGARQADRWGEVHATPEESPRPVVRASKQPNRTHALKKALPTA